MTAPLVHKAIVPLLADDTMVPRSPAQRSPLALIVDDDRAMRMLARATLEQSGLRVVEAGDGSSGLAAFQELRPDIVLLDVIMPHMDGFEACTQLRRLPYAVNTPVLMMTGLDDSASIERAYESGATDFITKPINWRILAHRVRYMLRSARLVDELTQINQKLNTAQNQLLQAEKMASIGQLTAGVAHEINNPIGYLSLNLGALGRYLAEMFTVIELYEGAEAAISDDAVLGRISAAKAQVGLDYIKQDMLALMAESHEGIDRVKKIVRDLKEFSHVGTERQWKWADLHHGIDSTLNIVANEIKYKAQVVKIYGALPEIECLPSQLNQVFMNLLVNAAHAIEREGTITVSTGAQGDEAWVEVADTGTGIKPEHIKSIFDPFFTTKPVGQGTGLGLSVSYSIVKKHNGRIDVNSEMGKGTTFRVVLPVRQPAAEHKTSEEIA